MHLRPSKKLSGILAPLFALRGRHDLGIGDVAALREFIAWAAEHGFGLVQLLPINETGADNSPYNAVSSSALDPATIETSPAAIPELSAADCDEVLRGCDLERMRSGPVDYRCVKPLKRELLERAFRAFERDEDAERHRQFKKFRRKNAAWLDDYALFRTLMAEHGTECWDQWPEDRQTAAWARKWLDAQPKAERRRLAERRRFFSYVQWIAYSQWRALKEFAEAHQVALMGDIPFGISYYSADVFAQPKLFNLEWSGGAPPERVFKSDPFTEKWGQNWGIPLYRWDLMRADDFAWWRQRVRLVNDVFHLFRIDHILGFYRLYSFPWRPEQNASFLDLTEDQARAKTGGSLPHFVPRDDSTPAHQAANCHDGAEYLSALIEEVGEYRVIGEDLGVVPPYVRPNLQSLGIAGFKIPYWEVEPDNRLTPAADYQKLSVVTLATHDHDPIRLSWEKWHAIVRTQAHDLHLSGVARWELVRLADWAGVPSEPPPEWSDDLRHALFAALQRSKSWIAISMITDLLGGAQRFNVPGAVSDQNWSERLDYTVHDLRENPQIELLMSRVHHTLEQTDRLPRKPARRRRA